MPPSLARVVSPSGCMIVAGLWVAGLIAEGGDGDHGPRGRIAGGRPCQHGFPCCSDGPGVAPSRDCSDGLRRARASWFTSGANRWGSQALANIPVGL